MKNAQIFVFFICREGCLLSAHLYAVCICFQFSGVNPVLNIKTLEGLSIVVYLGIFKHEMENVATNLGHKRPEDTCREHTESLVQGTKSLLH